jgi:predicted dehydrogenase
MKHNASRRTFLTAAAVAGAGLMVHSSLSAQDSKSPNEKIRFACIGVGGKGSSDSSDAGKAGDVVAICDVDANTLAGGLKRFANAKGYSDFRKLFDEQGKNIDAVTVSTPDHCHAVASAAALKLGKACFTQKPLTHCVWESRRLGELAAANKAATQMGNQGTANDSLREAAALIQAGSVGKVKEVHVWTNRPIWPQGGPRNKAAEPPAHLAWDLWLGPAPNREYAPGYHPFAWRGWWDFGTGALGDMACHTLNMPYMALALKDPVSIEAVTSGHNRDSYPKSSTITYQYPANDTRGPVTLVWYDGGRKPDSSLFGDAKVDGSGALIIGDKGSLYAPGDYAEKGITMLGGAEKVKVEIEKSPGHFEEWVRAIRGGKPARSAFNEYSCGLTETVLLGNLAVFVADKPNEPAKVEWDAKALAVKGRTDLEPFIKNPYRAGYEC